MKFAGIALKTITLFVLLTMIIEMIQNGNLNQYSYVQYVIVGFLCAIGEYAYKEYVKPEKTS